ncbi:MAG TPA: hypothetical protein VIQ31_21490 [Phormidium sp.]
MVYLAHFNEQYYLDSYPDVNASVNTGGNFFSGFEHFIFYGLDEGRSLVSPYFSEQGYLALYPDVANAVAAGFFSSGVEHFALRGADEGRYSPIATFDSEQAYLQKYPDVALAVNQGFFRSGYDHFLQTGQFEGRVPSYFNERDYLVLNPDVAAAVGVADPQTGLVAFNSGFEHYLLFGQFENRLSLFSGTRGNDVITSFGESLTALTGVEYAVLARDPFNYALGSTGVGEIDILIGGAQQNDFLLGLSRSPSNPNPRQLYVGGGNADYALIRGFERGFDAIQLVGTINDYTQQAIGANLAISTNTGDLVAIVEGVNTPLAPVTATAPGGAFLIA